MIAPDRRVGQLAHALAAARVGDDTEAVHKLRVASRRLAAWLRLGGYTVLRDDLAWLRAACGAVRDLDVLLAADDLPTSFRSWLEERRAALRPGLRDVLHDPRCDTTVEALSRLPAIPEDVAHRNLVRVLASVVRRGRAVDAKHDDVEALHALRRTLRRLRFALEWVGAGQPFLVDLQDAFGVLNDTVLRKRLLDEFLDADPAFVRATGRDLDAARAAVVRAWTKAQPNLMELAERWNCS